MAVIKIERKTYDTLRALDSFRSYWQVNERLIAKEANRLAIVDGPKWTPQTEDERDEFNAEIDLARYFYDRYVLSTFRYSCIAMLCGIVERELIRLVENSEKQNGDQKLRFKDVDGRFMEKIKKITKESLGLSLDKCPNYASFKDLQKIRNCIVHCYGELMLSKNKKDAEYLMKLNNAGIGFYASKATNIHLDEVCIEHFVKEMWTFFVRIFHRLEWPINDVWTKLKKT